MLTRREVFTRFLQCLVAGSSLYIVWKYVRGTGPSSMEVIFSKPPKEGEVLFSQGSYLVGLKQGPIAFSARCPHLGCRLEYAATVQHFQCPCHGSQFTLEGRRLEGPAKKGMTILDLRMDDRCGAYKITLPNS